MFIFKKLSTYCVKAFLFGVLFLVQVSNLKYYMCIYHIIKEENIFYFLKYCIHFVVVVQQSTPRE